MRPAGAAQRILVVRLSALGDCVHALPALAALRRALPAARLAWAIEDRWLPMFAGHPDVDEFVVVPRGELRRGGPLRRLRALRALRRRLRAMELDAVVDLQGLAKSALVVALSGAGLKAGPPFRGGGRELSWLFYNRRPRAPEGARHVAEQHLARLAPLGVDGAGELPAPVIPERPEAAARVRDALAAAGLDGARFAVLNPGAGWVTKRWPAGHFARLAGLLHRELGLRSLVTWFGPEERALAGQVAAAAPAGAAAVAPSTDLPEMAELLRRAAFYAGGDTGPTHVAAAAGAPTAALFGAADAARNRPLGPRVEVLAAGLECSPCWRRSGCRRAVACMERIRPEDVLAAAVRLRPAGD